MIDLQPAPEATSVPTEETAKDPRVQCIAIYRGDRCPLTATQQAIVRCTFDGGIGNAPVCAGHIEHVRNSKTVCNNHSWPVEFITVMPI